MIVAEVRAWQSRVCASIGYRHALALRGSRLRAQKPYTAASVHLGSWGGSPVLQGSDHKSLNCIQAA